MTLAQKKNPAKKQNKTQSPQARYLVLSDLHLGIKDSTINNPLVASGLIRYIHENAPFKAVILNGDVLDLNMSSFQMSVEGGVSKNVKVTGLRQFLSDLNRYGPRRRAVRTWVYIPGNHDYLVWTLLSHKSVYVDTLGTGKRLHGRRADLKEGTWKRGAAFISGVFPEELRKQVTVQYPDYVISTGGTVIVITHGHYLDRKQTLFKRLRELVKETGDQKQAIEKMYVETDRFQVMTNVLTYASDFQKFINYLLRTGRFAKNVGSAVGKYLGSDEREADFSVSPMRGERINKGQLIAAEFYLKFFRSYTTPPDHFIYGHTHRQGMSSTGKIPVKKRLFPEKTFKVYNSGSFIARGDIAASFIRIDILADGSTAIIPVKIDKNGKII